MGGSTLPGVRRPRHLSHLPIDRSANACVTAGIASRCERIPSAMSLSAPLFIYFGVDAIAAYVALTALLLLGCCTALPLTHASRSFVVKRPLTKAVANAL